MRAYAARFTRLAGGVAACGIVAAVSAFRPVPRLDHPDVLPGVVAEDSTIERTLPAESGGTLSLDLETGADVTITGWDRDSVKVHGRLAGRDWRQTAVTIERTAGGVRVATRYTGSSDSQSFDHGFTISVPKRYDVRINSVGGSVAIAGVDGDIRGHTGGGAITIERARGHVELSTGGGPVNVRHSTLSGSVSTGDGSVRLDDVRGSLTGAVGETRSHCTCRPGGSRRPSECGECRPATLPPAKQAIADQYARERAAGQDSARRPRAESTVALGLEFILRPGQTVLLGGTDYSLEFQKTDQIVRTPYAFVTGNPPYPVVTEQVPYDVVVKDTDGKTYATVVVTRSADACAARSGPPAATCWSALAIRTFDTTYCSRIGDQSASHACLEAVAAESGSGAEQICRAVTAPRSYCQLYAPDTWATLRDATHGFSLKYPAGWLAATTSNDASGDVFLHHDFPDLGSYGVDITVVPIDTVFHVADDGWELRYDQNSNTWMRRTYGSSVFSRSCEDISPIGTQHAAAYNVSNRHDPRYVVILGQGLLQIGFIPVDEPPSPDDIALFDEVLGTIAFDSTSSPITANCE